MSISVFPFIFSAVGYLALGLWVIAQRKSRVHRLYGVFCLMTCLWQGTWIVLFSSLTQSSLEVALRFAYTGLVFIPAVFYHFIIEFSEKEVRRRWLYLTYTLSFI